MSSKTNILTNFNRAHSSYSENDSIQKQVACQLTKLLQAKQYTIKSIFEIGCGTGNLTDLLLSQYPYANYTLNDLAPKMIEVAQSKYAANDRVGFHLGDIEQIELKKNYDLIASNMCLQWVENLDVLLERLISRAKVFAFSTLVQDSFSEWYNLLEQAEVIKHSPTYPSLEEMRDKITQLNHRAFHFRPLKCQVEFDSPLMAIKYLKNIGANSLPEKTNTNKLRYFIQDNRFLPCRLSYHLVLVLVEL